MNISRLTSIPNVARTIVVEGINNANSTKKRDSEEARKRREAELEEKRKKDRKNK